MNIKTILKYLWSLIIWAWFFLAWYIYSWSLFLPPHYHANFAVYIENKQVDFSSDEYMEDIAACSLTWEIAPKDRAHLHENNPDTIHIHADWVAWGHFFANIWYVMEETFIKTDSGEIIMQDSDNTIYYLLNGKEIKTPHNRRINSKDRLLVAYWKYDEVELRKLYNTVSSNAGEYNSKYDPWSCWGTNENGTMVMLKGLMHSLHWEWH